VGAGSIINVLPGALARSPEASVAEAAFVAVEDLAGALQDCAGGRELAQQGRPQDVVLAAALDADGSAPVLEGHAYVAAI